MVIRLFLLFLLTPFFVFSGAFTASVSRNQVSLGESFTLTLTLKDASSKVNPQTEFLQRYFTIHSQQQSSSTVILNGKLTSSVSWKYVLIPKDEGETIIPSISLETSEGTLATQPVAVRAAKGAISKNGQSNLNEPTVTVSVSNKKPYKNEPFFYSVRITSKQPLVNIQMQKFNVENAIVEIAGEPKASEKIGNGIPEGMIEFNYLITPLKSGLLQIPSNIVQGAIPLRRTLSSFLNDSMDPTSLMQGFEQWKPFALATEETVVDVQPTIADVNPWLPAKSLMIEEIFDEAQPLQVGEFFTRGFHLVAEGVNASQLPNLNERQIGANPVKIYADKPELMTEIDDGILRSSRKEQYTLIPQQSGVMTLPEISIAWWDVERKVKVVTTIPSRTLNILPATEKEVTSKPVNEIKEEVVSKETSVVISEQMNPLLYAVIVGMALLLAATIAWGIWLQKRMNRLLHPVKEIKPKEIKPVEQKKNVVNAKIVEKVEKTKNEKLNDLNPT